MHLKDVFPVDDPAAAVAVVRAHPLAAVVTPSLRATHMPCLAEDGLVILRHLAKADPVAAEIEGEVLLVFSGVRGYVSAT